MYMGHIAFLKSLNNNNLSSNTSLEGQSAVSSYDWCVSVAGEPTKGTSLDGIAGWTSNSVWIPQPRRRAPGWDGCRDRADGRTDLPQAGILILILRTLH